MTYLKYIQYFYLVIALIMIIDGVKNYQNGESIVMNLVIIVLAIFMFFFRRDFAQKYNKK
jgi:hypothetical protein